MKYIRLDTIPRCDGPTDRRTDRQTELVKQYRAVHAMQADARLKITKYTCVSVITN